MSDISPKHATGVYQNSAELAALSSREVMKRLMGMLIVNIERAKQAYLAKNLESMAELNQRSLKILAAMRLSLRPEHLNTTEDHVLKLASYLRGFYRDIYIRLVNVLLQPDVSKEFDHLLARLKENYIAWAGNADTPEPANVPAAPAKPPIAAAYIPDPNLAPSPPYYA